MQTTLKPVKVQLRVVWAHEPVPVFADWKGKQVVVGWVTQEEIRRAA